MATTVQSGGMPPSAASMKSLEELHALGPAAQWRLGSGCAQPAIRTPCRGDARVRGGGTNLASRKVAELLKNTVRKNMAAAVGSLVQCLSRRVPEGGVLSPAR